MIRHLELLAPARNADIGIAAIDCGADAVYVAGPAFGARQAAGNPMEEIRRLTGYAHRFGARIFLTLNTILFDNELAAAERLLAEAKDAGVDAVIAQDLAVWSLTDLPIHASTQCAVRTPEKALMYESLGTSRIVLEREMSLDRIKAIRNAVGCELEFFVHGALCVCYSGQCYLSQRIAGRSANRGECIQACRSLYSLEDESGKVIVRDKALLSLKDYNLKDRLEDLAEAGICSFKIEGRLKNASYARNVTRAYSSALDELVAAHPEKYRRSSFGRVEGGFTPDLGKTFNRGYTQLFLDGKRSEHWSSMDAPKSIGEEIGTVVSVNQTHMNGRGGKRNGTPRGERTEAGGDITITVRLKNPAESLRNGDGFSFIAKGRGEIVGFRGDVCEGNRITCGDVPEIYKGARLYRNLSAAFEKELESNTPIRRIPVTVDITVCVSGVSPGVTSEPADVGGKFLLRINATSEDGREISFERDAGEQTAENAERMRGMFSAQISKATGEYSFSLKSLEVRTPDGTMPFLPVSSLNAVRRDIAAALEDIPCKAIPLPENPNRIETGKKTAQKGSSGISLDSINKDHGIPEEPPLPLVRILDIQEKPHNGTHLSYKANIANHLARKAYYSMGASDMENAFELSPGPDAELMRTKYCIRYELGLCPVRQQSAGIVLTAGERSGDQRPHSCPTHQASRLCLTNNGKRYHLTFDCAACEMVIKSTV